MSAKRPAQPPPCPASRLDALVATGDAALVRDFFATSFWGGRMERPTWDHVKSAVLRENRAMLRLLVTYYEGCPSAADMTRLRSEAGGKFPDCVKLLRQCGLKFTLPPSVDAPPQKPAAKNNDAGKQPHITELEDILLMISKKLPDQTDWDKAAELVRDILGVLDDLPARSLVLAPKASDDWQKILGALQKTGASEAVIAGECLHDVFNGKAPKTVDIFLRTRGDMEKNREFLKKAFQAAAVKPRKQAIGTMVFGGYKEELFPKPATVIDIIYQPQKTGARKKRDIISETHKETWNVVAGGDGAEYAKYRITFVEEIVPTVTGNHFPGFVAKSFDFGVCQAAYDGKTGLTLTDAYLDDCRNKCITAVHPDRASQEQLERLVKKNPGWDLCEESKKILGAPKSAPFFPPHSPFWG